MQWARKTEFYFYSRLILVLFLLPLVALSQTDSAVNKTRLSGSVLVTNNGISLIPTFSLGKPAAIFNLSMAKKKSSFDPELRFSLEGKPWSFLFWWRYKLVSNDRFRFTVGGHPALNFKTETVHINGITNQFIVTRRYLAGELASNYLLSKNLSVGTYYLYSRGLDKGTTTNTHFITINSSISHIEIAGFFLRLVPQLYYLKMDQYDGYYFTSSFNLARTGVPLSVSSIINKAIESNIPGSKNFNWNVSLVYRWN
jgi:hypothetical protein